MASSSAISLFVEVLQSYEHLLHAETQAIAAKQVDLIDSILIQKDECMDDLLAKKDKLETNPRDIDSVNSLMDKVVELQQRNFKTFSDLVNNQRDKQSGNPAVETDPNAKRVRQTYLINSPSRISHLWD